VFTPKLIEKAYEMKKDAYKIGTEIEEDQAVGRDPRKMMVLK